MHLQIVTVSRIRSCTTMSCQWQYHLRANNNYSNWHIKKKSSHKCQRGDLLTTISCIFKERSWQKNKCSHNGWMPVAREATAYHPGNMYCGCSWRSSPSWHPVALPLCGAWSVMSLPLPAAGWFLLLLPSPPTPPKHYTVTMALGRKCYWHLQSDLVWKSSQNELNDSCQKLPTEKQLQNWKLSDMWPEQWIRVLTGFFFFLLLITFSASHLYSWLFKVVMVCINVLHIQSC